MDKKLNPFSYIFLAAGTAAFFLVFAVIFFGPFYQLDNIRYPMLAWLVFYGISCAIEREFVFVKKVEAIFSARWFPWAVFGVMTFCFIRIKWLEYVGFHISGVDFSHIDYAIWNTLHGRFMEIPIIAKQPTYDNFFGNHFSPILYVWVAARWLYDHPFTTLVVHAVALAAAILPMHAMASKQTGRPIASILVLTYLFTGITASTLQFDFHQEAFYPLALTILLYGLSDPNRFYVLAGFLLTISIKEDAGLYIFGTGLVFAIIHRKRRLESLFIGLAGLAYTGLAYKVFMPMYQPAEKTMEAYYLPMWSHYGNSVGEIVKTMLLKPHLVLADLFGNKSFYKLIFAWGLLPFFSRYTLAAILPLIVCVTAKGAPHHLGLYYGATLLPFFFFASMRTLAWLKNTNASLKMVWVWAFLAFAFSAFVGGSYLRFREPNPAYAQIPEMQRKVAGLHGIVYVQGGLLPYLKYAQNLRRIDTVDIQPDADFYVLADGISTGPLFDDVKVLQDKLNAKHKIVFAEPPFRIYEVLR